MKKIKFFKKETLTIANRLIISTKSFIQIRNITRVWHGKPDIEIPVFKIIAVFALCSMSFNTPLSGFGVCVFMINLGVVGYYVYLYSNYTLNFELSSGEVYAFTSSDKDFLVKSYCKVEEIINGDDLMDKKIEINFNSCEIDVVNGNDNIINKGDYNIVNKGNDNNSKINHIDRSINIDKSVNDSLNTKVEINYDRITRELESLISNQTLKTEDIKIIKEAISNAKNEDLNKMKSSLGKLSTDVLSIISGASAFITIAEFIKQFIK